MVNFSTNQVMQFYVLDGSAVVVPTLDGKAQVKFTFADGETICSDVIENVMWGKLTDADSLATPLKKITLTMDEVVPGENYVVRVKYPEVGGLGVEGWVTKTAVYTAKKDDAPQNVYDALASTLEVAFKNDGVLTVDATSGLVISCADPTKAYKRGIRPVAIPDFQVSFAPVTVDGVEDTKWATLTESTSGSVKNGYKVSDMEYFALGERGDQYRNVDYINAIESNYRVTNPKGEYDVLVVHYAYKGANQNSHKSEKDLIVVAPKGSEDLSTLAGDIKKALGGSFTKVVKKEESAL